VIRKDREDLRKKIDTTLQSLTPTLSLEAAV
jgi:hypothetical protein